LTFALNMNIVGLWTGAARDAQERGSVCV